MSFKISLPLNTFWIPLAVAIAGGFLAFYLHIPGGWLIGAMFATILFVMSGREVVSPIPLRNVLFVSLGLMFGSSMTPDMLSGMARWPYSMAMVIVTMVLIVLASMFYFRIVAKWDNASSLLASIPGALSHVMSVAGEAGADIKRVAISQSTRIFMLAALVPIILSDQPQSAISTARLPISLPDMGLLCQ